MRAGALRHWLTFESLTTTLDEEDGSTTEAWVDAFPVNTRMPCEVVALSGRELLSAQSVQSKVSTRVTVRYRPGFTASMRARGEGVVYNIEAIVPDPESRIEYVTLLCSSGVNQGGTA